GDDPGGAPGRSGPPARRGAAERARPPGRQARLALAAGRALARLRARLRRFEPPRAGCGGRRRRRRAAHPRTVRGAGRNRHREGGRLTAEETPTFEAALQKLDEIVQKLEKGELPLEQSLVLYEEGVRLSRLCHAKLEEAEGKIELLLKDARGDLVLDASGRPKKTPFTGGNG